jgi:enamine deaminase RidA (YjgF/YER057c/UK114 family)
MQPTEKLSELGIVLPSAPKAAGLYKPVMLDQNLLYFSGHLPLQDDGTMITGKLGADFSTEKGKEAARVVGLNILASATAHLGSIDRIEQGREIIRNGQRGGFVHRASARHQWMQ